MTLRYGSVCSGIEAASVAWHPLGWRPQFFSEIEAAPRAILKHHWAEVPLHGDFTTIREGEYGAIDLLVGGTPCQDFSIAGLRAGLDGERGNLTLEYGRLAQRLRPRWLSWENVPGVLSSNRGRDFASVLGLLAGRIVSVPAGGWGNAGVVPGYRSAYGLAWRVLDAQYVRVDGFGRAVPQRRRRVFLVGYLGDWRRAAAVLFELASLRGDPAPCRGAGARVASALTSSLGGGSGGEPRGADDNAAQANHIVAYGGNDTRGPIEVSTALNAHGGPMGRMDFESETFIAQTLRARDGAKGVNSDCTDTLIPIAFDTTQITSRENRANPQPGDPCHPLSAGAHPPAIAFDCKAGGDTGFAIGEIPGSLRGEGHGGGHAAIAQGRAVRRLTPTECERLQGFPDGHTAVPWRGGIMPDGRRYKALGNSMAVNCMRWIGRRIEMVEALAASEFTEAA